jgi:Subtilase family
MSTGVRRGLHLLRLSRTLEPGERRPRRGFGGGRKHDDLPAHGKQLEERAREISMRHLERPAVLGVDPKLILVFDLAGPVEPDEFRRAGLRVLDGSDSRVVVAFADDPALAAFHERLDALQGEIPEGQVSEPYAGFFDAIESLRTLEPIDRLTDALQQQIADASGDEVLRLDIECWHPDDADIASAWLGDLSKAIIGLGGRVADRYVHDGAGLLLVRAYVSVAAVAQLAELDVIARIDVLPRPALTLPQLFGSDLNDLLPASPPVEGAPIVGLIDSGVRSAHPLLAGAVIAADPIGAGITEGEDQHGHGTMVAALIAHGPIEGAVARGGELRPLCRIASARVLNAENEFPEDVLWEHDLADAIEWCVAQGASLINVSIGDDRSVLTAQRQTAGAAVIDELARRHGVTIVTCTGNVSPQDYLPDVVESAALTYPEDLLRAGHARLIDPAPAMLALTVGAITTAAAATGLSARETVVRVPMGNPGWPSPFTRIGPGVAGAVKPELVERGGTLGIESGRLVSNDAELAVVSASASADRVLAFDIGTSFAAPLVTRVAAAVKARFPEFSSNLVRALVLSSAAALHFGPELVADRPGDQQDAVRRLSGYGRPTISRATESTSHRVVLVAEDAIPIDGVHVYELPIPGSFRSPGGQRGVDIALAYDPRTRARRLDYLANHMEFHLVRGLSVDEVVASFARLDPGEDVDLEDAGGDGELEPDSVPGEPANQAKDEPTVPPTLSQLGARVRKLIPSTPVRSRGANQVGRTTFSHRFKPDRHEPMHLVVRNINQWDDSTARQPYALAVAMWRTETQAELYAELEAQLEAVVELPIEIELEV